jgi:methyl-accepting chemotaxis protein
VAKNVANADDVARAAAKEGAAGQQAVQEALAAMGRVADVTDKTAASIVNLGKRSEEIGAIVNVINEIADQTNLLALNAAIEAARAGDAGRGFAVVADEVRKLAERSVGATKEIGQVIRQVQADTEDSVRYGELATQEARSSMELSSVAGNALVNIVKNIEQTSTLMSQVASMTEEQSSASGQVIKAVEKMGQATAIVANASREQALGGRQIRIAVERMNSITHEVTGATREQAQGSRQIRIAVENMNNVTQQVSIATREQALSARQIVESVNKMNTMTQSVANATSEQKKGGEMVVSAVENISDLTRQNLSAVEQLGKSAESLTHQADELAKLVTQFRV